MERAEAAGGAARTLVAIPAAVIDTILPQLKDTELRVLLIVLRQTWGRNKEVDWLSHTQLKARTGRASEAVSGALDALVQRGLVTVRDERGAFLSDAVQRRRSRARLYLCPGPALRYFGEHLQAEKPKTTSGEEREPRRFRKTRHEPRQPDSRDKGMDVAALKRQIRATLQRLP